MPSFEREHLNLNYIDEGPVSGQAVLLVHGFASSIKFNWIDPGWIETLTGAGYRTIAFDHRGHGASDKPTDEAAYTPTKMAEDAFGLLDHLDVKSTVFFGYSMGARVCAFAALARPETIDKLILGGLGYGLVSGVGDWDPIAKALRAPSIDDVDDPRGQMFRAFADRTKSDREALAACIAHSRQELTEEDVGRIEAQTLIGVGSKDEIAGSPDRLAALMPKAQALTIPNRDHMLAVGDKAFKSAVLEFLLT
ncbi:probable hydrolase protein [Fulvimarina pelagi HTCC2506]|uniref:Probable hydrolase protein n=2 Tax=Fulvimarina pelagi TaxID=217511 RepID=Q0FZY3_9HYPH|nr:alpha/beta hydrolase [Fulvimarina pelagi]EAU40458.1 probable hydrolase protein [Fulvimarina pelagi HTCC2506]BAT31487.1 probable hydrolase protein [Fulvimarina pelagi]